MRQSEAESWEWITGWWRNLPDAIVDAGAVCVGTGSQEEYPRWLRNSLEDGLELMHENELISGYCKWVRAGPQEWSPR